MKKISFTKMSGAGNDFVMINLVTNPPIEIIQSVIQKICDRHYGIGADGLITVNHSSKYDFEMNYYNADGSTGSLCGNGARCAIKFAADNNIIKKSSAEFLSNGVKYSGSVLNDENIRFNFNTPENFKENLSLNVAGKTVKCSFINTGSPHVVVFINSIFDDAKTQKPVYNNLNELPVELLGREIRYKEEFAPEGTNANFIKIVDGKIHIRSYERGVEAETLSCGTGSVAAAAVSFFNKNLIPPIEIITKQKEKLIVNFTIENEQINNLSLTGPVKTIFTGTISEKFFE